MLSIGTRRHSWIDGQRVTGGAARATPEQRAQKREARNEANEEVRRATRNLESWIALCDKPTYDAAAEICRRVVRGDLARR